jgi:iron complex outermembrane receptor protein
MLSSISPSSIKKTESIPLYEKKTWEVFDKINNIFNQSNGIWIKDDSVYPVNF